MIDFDNPPRRVTAEDGAALVSHTRFKISSRTLERWACWKHRTKVNGKNTLETAELLAEADEIFAKAEREKELTAA